MDGREYKTVGSLEDFRGLASGGPSWPGSLVGGNHDG